MKKLIVLDPGHGPTTNPYVIHGFFEGTQMFIYSRLLGAELEARGIGVIYTREQLSDDPSLEERGSLAGKMKADAFISLHSNAPSSTVSENEYPLIRGVETYYSLSDPYTNTPAAALLNSAAVRAMNTVNRGIKTREYPDWAGVDYYGVLRNSASSGCRAAFLIEHGFHTNPTDTAFLTDSACLQRLASEMADAIEKMSVML